jgi:hypothetical protein
MRCPSSLFKSPKPGGLIGLDITVLDSKLLDFYMVYVYSCAIFHRKTLATRYQG